MMKNSSHSNLSLRKQLVSHLEGGQAFSPIDKVLDNMSYDLIGIVPDGLPYSFYQQFYHIWYAQKDIIEYCKDDDYKAPNWPDDYWPENSSPDHESEWKELIQNFFRDRESLSHYILDSSNKLFEPFESDSDHNLFREIQVVIEHNSYHTGQLYLIYRLLN
ncbi:MAG: DinB family protein [Balneolaceae bacterium]|nr:DinB family protein [Balneolaceae bacterium]